MKTHNNNNNKSKKSGYIKIGMRCKCGGALYQDTSYTDSSWENGDWGHEDQTIKVYCFKCNTSSKEC